VVLLLVGLVRLKFIIYYMRLSKRLDWINLQSGHLMAERPLSTLHATILLLLLLVVHGSSRHMLHCRRVLELLHGGCSIQAHQVVLTGIPH